MTPAARIAAVIEILSELPSGEIASVSAGAALRRGLQARRYAGSGDRQAISALFWSVHRSLARLGWHLGELGQEATGRALVLAGLCLGEGKPADEIKALFGGGEKHAPPALSDDEIAFIDQLEGRELDDAGMPRAMRLEWPEALLADAEAALATLGVKLAGVQVKAEGPDWFHPGRRGQLIQGRTVLASFGEIHPAVAEAYGLKGRVVGFEIHTDDVPMPKSKGPAKPLLSLSVYQPVTRDFAFIVDRDVAAGDLLKAVKSGAGPLLSEMRIFDLYEGANIGEGKKSVAVTITLTPTKATLTEEEIEKISAEIVKIAGKNCGATLRG